jgi:peptidyl-prolyl cis-trans isomerase C
MSCSVHTAIPAGKPVPVSVNGITIARDAIVREMQHHPAKKPIEAWQNAARALVVRELLLQRARALAIAPEPASDEAGRRETDDEAIMRAVVEREVALPQADDETCRRYYANNIARFRSEDIYEVSHILFAADPADRQAFAQAHADAAAVLETLKERPEIFADLARVHSRCPSAALGGNLGQITRGQTTPEFEDAMLKLAPGEIAEGPVETRYGFHVIRLERKHDGRTLPYELVAGRIADYLSESVQRRAHAQYVARLASAAAIEGIALDGAEAHRVY